MTGSGLKKVLNETRKRQISADSFVKVLSKLSEVKKEIQKKSVELSKNRVS